MQSLKTYEARLKKNTQSHKVGLVLPTWVTKPGPHKHDLRHQWMPQPMHTLQPTHCSEVWKAKTGLELMTHLRKSCSACSWLSHSVPRVLGKGHSHQVTILPAQKSFQGTQRLFPTPPYSCKLACILFCFLKLDNTLIGDQITQSKQNKQYLRLRVSKLWSKGQIWPTACFPK